MANETVLNPNIENSNATVLNPSAAASNATVLNTDIVSSVEIQKGTVLCDDYTVNGKLDIPTGEADLYLCTKKRQTYVAKVYRRKSAIKDEIIKKLLSINSPYVAKIYASGSFNGFPVEILPYYKNGSLKGEKFTLEELREEKIDKQVDKIVYAAKEPSRGIHLARNRHLVDGSKYCICYCTRPTGGTAYTVKYALKKGLTVYNASSFDVNELLLEKIRLEMMFSITKKILDLCCFLVQKTLDLCIF